MPLKLNTLVDCSNDITQIGSVVHGLTLQVQSILLCTPVVLHVASPPFNLPIGSALVVPQTSIDPDTGNIKTFRLGYCFGFQI